MTLAYKPTCHWCHVMAHESFEDQEVAGILNENFISIKVDREERPDIDAVYMNVTQQITGNGGWPMTIIMTPEQKPFFAATYIPKHSKYGMAGLTELLETVALKWKNDKKELIDSGSKITEFILSLESQHLKGNRLNKKVLERAIDVLENSFDEEYGGFGEIPKFPKASCLLFLLNYYLAQKDEPSLYMAEKTLDCMYRGGIFDHVGNGFSRYSTDGKWLVPHFEKMLYDNALLAYTYAYAYQITKKGLYKDITERILEYVLNEMTDEKGGFYSAQDADSRGEEGKYYTFTPGEIKNVLGEDDGKYFIQFYGITEEGNFEGENIPNLIYNDKYFKQDRRIKEINKKLYEYRLRRNELHKDDKILTSWNGMMIAALAKAYKALNNEEYLHVAEKAVNFIEKYLIDDDVIGVRYREGVVLGNGTLDDYAMYCWALIELYEATCNFDYIERAVVLNNKMFNLFWDNDNGGFFMKSIKGEKLLYNPKEIFDGAVPSGNSVAALNILKLSRITGTAQLEELADKQLRFISNNVADYPVSCSFALLSVIFELYPSKEIVCLVKDDEGFEKIKNILRKNIKISNTGIVVKYFELKKSTKSGVLPDFIRNYELVENKDTFYICENKNCSLPFNDVRRLEEELSQ